MFQSNPFQVSSQGQPITGYRFGQMEQDAIRQSTYPLAPQQGSFDGASCNISLPSLSPGGRFTSSSAPPAALAVGRAETGATGSCHITTRQIGNTTVPVYHPPRYDGAYSSTLSPPDPTLSAALSSAPRAKAATQRTAPVNSQQDFRNNAIQQINNMAMQLRQIAKQLEQNPTNKINLTNSVIHLKNLSHNLDYFSTEPRL